jgi:NAD(P)H dehydrogenase (quinone)
LYRECEEGPTPAGGVGSGLLLRIGLLWRALLLLVAMGWSALVCQAETRVLITFDSVDGHTQIVADWVAQGVRSQPDTVLRLKRVQETTHEDLIWADAIIVGSPVYNAGLTSAVGTFLAEWPFEGGPLKNRVGGAFVSAQGATAGAENAMFDVLKTMMIFRMIIVGGEDWRSGFGVAYIRDGSNERTLGFVEAQAMNLAKRVCQVAEATKDMRPRR